MQLKFPSKEELFKKHGDKLTDQETFQKIINEIYTKAWCEGYKSAKEEFKIAKAG